MSLSSPDSSCLVTRINIFSAVIFLLLSGCANVPETDIRQPFTARAKAETLPDSNGAIFQASASRAKPSMGLFEDRRAKRVGDLLTVNLVEKTSVSRDSATTDERKANGSLDIPKPVIAGKSLPIIGATSWEPSSNNKIELKDNDTNSNTVSGTITVTVVEELSNGNLVVAGEKTVRVNQDTEYIRLAGVVNPNQITAANTVNSTQMSEVQLESTNNQRFDKSQVGGMLARFFLTLMPL